jgi:hypothetical protein
MRACKALTGPSEGGVEVPENINGNTYLDGDRKKILGGHDIVKEPSTDVDAFNKTTLLLNSL